MLSADVCILYVCIFIYTLIHPGTFTFTHMNPLTYVKTVCIALSLLRLGAFVQCWKNCWAVCKVYLALTDL